MGLTNPNLYWFSKFGAKLTNNSYCSSKLSLEVSEVLKTLSTYLLFLKMYGWSVNTEIFLPYAKNNLRSVRWYKKSIINVSFFLQTDITSTT
jgi:hypothetical protein